MARPAETYRGARRNAWRSFGDVAGAYRTGGNDWSGYRLAGDNWRRPFDDTLIKLKPYVSKGWNYGQKNVLVPYQHLKPIWLQVKRMLRRNAA